MSAPESTVYRALRCGEREALRGATADEIHVWLELWWGRDSTRIGVVWCRAGALADDLPELRNSRQRVTAALDRLQERGLIRWDAGQKVAVRCGFAQEHMPDDLNRAT